LASSDVAVSAKLELTGFVQSCLVSVQAGIKKSEKTNKKEIDHTLAALAQFLILQTGINYSNP
jgi:hypothetical protein